MSNIYCIEGIDNIGKTTTINRIKDILGYANIQYIKFPSIESKILCDDAFREYNQIIKEYYAMVAQYNKLTLIERPKYDNKMYNLIYRKDKIIDYIIEQMLYDMERDGLFDDNEEEKTIITDRGPLSTFLYQYINKGGPNEEITEMNVKLLIYNFFTHIIHTSSTSKLNMILLYNNHHHTVIDKDKDKDIDTWEYYIENNVIIQNRASIAIDYIIKSLDSIQISLSNDIQIIPICINDLNGNRKSSESLTNEIVNIMNL